MPKKFEIQETPGGICSDPNVMVAPLGALKTCDNCEIKRDGIVEARYGANPVTTTGTTLTTIDRMFEFDEDILLYDAISVTNYFEFLGNLGNHLHDESSGHPEFFPGYYNVQEDRGNLYVACQDGIRKITGADSTNLYKTGLLNDTIITSVQADAWSYSEWWNINTFIKYRTTRQYTDSNGVVLESVPSYWCVGSNIVGLSVSKIRIYFGFEVKTGDVIRIFRTLTAATEASLTDTFFLSLEYTVTAADVAAGTKDIRDFRKESELSETLYTNSENEGLLQRNYIPPASKVITKYKKSIFYSNVIEPSRINFTIRDTRTDIAGDANGAGVRIVTGTRTIGSNRITAISTSMNGVAVGQRLIGPGIPSNTYVTAYDVPGTWIDMTANSTSTITGLFSCVDTITLGFGSTYETFTGNTDLLQDIIRYSSYYVAEITDIISTSDANVVSVSIRRKALNSSIFYVWATHGLSIDETYSPTFTAPTWNGSAFVYSTTGATSSDMLSKPGREYWSKSDQPEHVPETNNHDVGDSNKAIIQAVVTKDGRIVFKEDGIYVVSGDNAISGWTIRMLDSDTLLVNSSCAIFANEAVYALTNKGLIRVTVYGIEPISNHYIREYIYSNIEIALSNRESFPFVWLLYDKRENSLMFSVTLYANTIYIYNINSNAFYTWSFYRVRHIIPSRYEYNKMYFSGTYISGSSFKLWSSVSNAVRGGDYRRLKTISSKPDSVTINFSSAHEASVGDQIIDISGNYMQEILTVVDSDTVTVANNTNFPVSNVLIYTPFICTIRWMPKLGETRALRKNFVACSFMFKELSDTVNAELQEYLLSLKDGGTDYGPFRINTSDKTVRCIIPPDCAREQFIEPEITISQVNGTWKLVGMGIEYYSQAPRGV